MQTGEVKGGAAAERRRLLLLDTCGAEASLALAADGRVVAESRLPGRSASEGMIPAVREMLVGAGWMLAECAAIVVVRGPGSFTGVRVGLSAAKGLSEGSGVPLIALSRLEVLLAKLPEAIAVLDAGRGTFFWGVGGERAEQGIGDAEFVLGYAARAGLRVICEEGMVEKLGGKVEVVPALGAGDALGLAMARLEAAKFDDPMLLDALYLHRTEEETLERQRRHAELKLAAGR